MSADKELIERLRSEKPIPGERVSDIMVRWNNDRKQAAARLEALQPSPETSLQNMQTRGAVGREAVEACIQGYVWQNHQGRLVSVDKAADAILALFSASPHGRGVATD